MTTTFGQRLRDLRKKRGFSLDELAAKAGVSRAYLWKLEKKPDTNPSLELIAKLAEGLGTTVGRLLPEIAEADTAQDVPIPPSLAECQKRYRVPPEEDLQDLARVNFRGERPVKPEDWLELYLTLKRAVGDQGE